MASAIISETTISDRTAIWKEKTQHCKRDIIIKAVALAVIGAAIVATLPFTSYFIMAGTGAAAAISAVVNLGILFCGAPAIFLSLEFTDWTDYGNHHTAKDVVKKITNISLNSKAEEVLNRPLVKYGFLSQEVLDEMNAKRLEYCQKADNIATTDPQLSERYAELKELANRWERFRQERLLPNLPQL